MQIRGQTGGYLDEKDSADTDIERAWMKPRRIALTAAHCAALGAEKLRTGVDVTPLFKSIESPPRGLKPHIIHQWLSGKTGTARQDHYEAVLAAWRSLPDILQLDGKALGIGPVEMQAGRIVLNDRIRDRLHSLQNASGKGPTALLQWVVSQGMNPPEGLKASTIAQWLNGTAKTAAPEELRLVIEAWAKASERGLGWIALTEELQARLRPYRDAGLLPSRLFKDAPDKPEDLTPAMISRWLAGTVRRIRKDHLDWVLGRCN